MSLVKINIKVKSKYVENLYFTNETQKNYKYKELKNRITQY